MARFYQKPENALKRAEELIAVNQHGSALELLHDIIMSKRSRSTPLTSLEPIMEKFVELAVLLKRGKTAKEGLHQYKNISQNITVATIELVIKRFIDLSEAKVLEAQAIADKINLDNVDDLEAIETPESIILSTVSGDVSKDRTDREVVTPWLKFLWEAYRTALDILRNNARLELLYQTVASQAFKFCLRYTRKTEFRRLCELLRQHLATAAKYSHQTHAINLNDMDTLQRHLDTRFDQLNASAELELWQEAFRVVEDIHNLLATSKKAAKPFMMANYYEKLARIFLVGENYLFHAAAWSKYYGMVRLNRNLPEEEHQRMSSIVLVSALSIPIITASKASSSYTENDDYKPKVQKLTNLLRVSKTPSREALLREALNKNVFSRVLPELQDLHNILEVEFHPLSICKKIGPILAKLSKHKDLGRYIQPLHQVVLTRLLQQLSQVYDTITMDSIAKLASFPDAANVGLGFDSQSIEKFIMNGCRKGELSIRINHMSKTLTFEADIFSGAKGSISEGPKLQALPAEQMRLHLTRLAKRLSSAIDLIDPSRVKARESAKRKAVEEAIELAEEERNETISRRVLIEKKKELKESESAKKAREEERIRQMRQVQEAEAERLRIEEETKRREVERMQALRAEREREEAKKLAEKIANDMKGKNLKDDLENLDTKTLMEKQLELLQKEQTDLQLKTKTLAKRIDHTERAFRKAEKPLWITDFEEQGRQDKAIYDAVVQKKLQESAAAHAKGLEVKQRMQRMIIDFKTYSQQHTNQKRAEYSTLREEANRKIEEAKQLRLDEIDRLRAAREERLRQEQIESAHREAEEEARKEALEKERAERAAIEEQRKTEEAERQKKLEEQSAKQRERERLAEEKIQAVKAAAVTTTPESRPDAWRKLADDSPKWRPSRGSESAEKPGVWRPSRLREGENSERPSERRDDIRRSETDQQAFKPRQREGASESESPKWSQRREIDNNSRDDRRDVADNADTWRNKRQQSDVSGRSEPAAGGDGGWRKKDDGKESSKPSGGKYVPPSRR